MQSTPKLSDNRIHKNIPMTTRALQRYADERDILVLPFELHHAPSLSVMDDQGRCAIGISPFLSEAEEHTCLGHEMGHCVTGAFYRPLSSAAVRGKGEYKADKWAIYHLVPYDALQSAYRQGFVTPWQLAEHFNVTEEFMHKALDFYECVRPME